MVQEHISDRITANSRNRPLSIRTQLLVTINLVLIIGLGLLLVIDYQRNVAQRIVEKRVALHEEAQTLATSIQSLRHLGTDELQAYLDSVCARMLESSSPGHHIALRLGDVVLQAQSHHRASPAFLTAMEIGSNASDGRATVEGKSIIVTSDRDGDLVVYVSEYVSDVLGNARSEVVGRTLAIALLGVFGAIFVNLVLVRVVTRPLRRLVQTVRQIGQGQTGLQAGRFNSAEFTILADEISAMSSSLASAEKERIRQIEKARMIQEHLCPNLLKVPGLKLARLYEPATGIAGDYFDLIELNNGSWLFCMADVCDHGVPAAMGAAVLKTLLLAASEVTREPGEILKIINKRFRMVTLPENFASMILVRWDPLTSKITYASAGHETCYCISCNGTTVELTSTGMVLGVEPQVLWLSRSLSVCPGDRLILLTDGAIETADPQGRLFGRDRTRQFFLESNSESPNLIARNLSRALAEYRGDRPARDDVTILTIEFGPKTRSAQKGIECDSISALPAYESVTFTELK